MTLHLGVVGSRSITDREKVMLALERAPFLPNHVKSLTPLDIDLCLVSGGAQGPDTIAENWAEEQGFTTDIKEPDWDNWRGEHPAKARNTDIARASTQLSQYGTVRATALVTLSTRPSTEGSPSTWRYSMSDLRIKV